MACKKIPEISYVGKFFLDKFLEIPVQVLRLSLKKNIKKNLQKKRKIFKN